MIYYARLCIYIYTYTYYFYHLHPSCWNYKPTPWPVRPVPWTHSPRMRLILHPSWSGVYPVGHQPLLRVAALGESHTDAWNGLEEVQKTPWSEKMASVPVVIEAGLHSLTCARCLFSWKCPWEATEAASRPARELWNKKRHPKGWCKKPTNKCHFKSTKSPLRILRKSQTIQAPSTKSVGNIEFSSHGFVENHWIVLHLTRQRLSQGKAIMNYSKSFNDWKTPKTYANVHSNWPSHSFCLKLPRPKACSGHPAAQRNSCHLTPLGRGVLLAQLHIKKWRPKYGGYCR